MFWDWDIDKEIKTWQASDLQFIPQENDLYHDPVRDTSYQIMRVVWKVFDDFCRIYIYVRQLKNIEIEMRMVQARQRGK